MPPEDKPVLSLQLRLIAVNWLPSVLLTVHARWKQVCIKKAHRWKSWTVYSNTLIYQGWPETLCHKALPVTFFYHCYLPLANLVHCICNLYTPKRKTQDRILSSCYLCLISSELNAYYASLLTFGSIKSLDLTFRDRDWWAFIITWYDYHITFFCTNGLQGSLKALSVLFYKINLQFMHMASTPRYFCPLNQFIIIDNSSVISVTVPNVSIGIYFLGILQILGQVNYHFIGLGKINDHVPNLNEVNTSV